MSKIIKNGSLTIAVLSNGDTVERENLTDEEYLKLIHAEKDEDILAIMDSSYNKAVEEKKIAEQLIAGVKKSNILSFRGESAYWEDISMLTVPKELVASILDAEEKEDEIRLETYKNFWTLMSLNPDETCRKNLFWYLTKNELVISRSGFFVAYRNADKTEQEEVFTDHHSKTFKIRIGEMVVMDRDECDSNHNITCSKGLHLANRFWLTKGYYGGVGLVCLCNPAEVVAVPHQDNYGKLRTCSYLPIDFAEYGDDGHPVPYNEKDGFECEYVPKVIYEGLMGTEQDTNYKIVIPDIPGINKESIADKLLDLARETIAKREE